MKKNQPESIADILARMVQTTPLGTNLEQARIWENWEQLAGKHLAAHSRPHSVKDGVLHITVESTVWMHKLSYMKWDLIRRINHMSGKELANDVFFMLEKDDPEKQEDECR